MKTVLGFDKSDGTSSSTSSPNGGYSSGSGW